MLRKPHLVRVLAFATLFISITETSYAQPTMEVVVEVEDYLPTAADLRAISPSLDSAEIPGESEPTTLTLLEMGNRSSVLAWDLLMVSVMVRQVDKARKPNGARAIAAEIAKEKYGWGSWQFSCLDTLWTKESHWNYRARNKRSGAHGIPQALPATKMAIFGADWRTNPVTQILWGLHYIDVRYETPCKALSKFKRSRYY